MATHQKKHIQASGNKNILRKKEDITEFYAIVKQPLGNSSFKCSLLNNEEFIAKPCGKMRRTTSNNRSNFLNANDFILVEKDSLKSTNPTYTIITKYSESDKKELQKMGEDITSQPRNTNPEKNVGTEIRLESQGAVLKEEADDKDDIDIDDI